MKITRFKLNLAKIKNFWSGFVLKYLVRRKSFFEKLHIELFQANNVNNSHHDYNFSDFLKFIDAILL